MSSPVALLPLRYLIAKTSDRGVAGAVTLIGYSATSLPTLGVPAGYINLRQEKKGRKPGVEYLPEDKIEREYGEPAFVFGTQPFWDNLNAQVRKWKALGCVYFDVDNLDTYTVEQCLEVLDELFTQGLRVYAKNPQLVPGDEVLLIKHRAVVAILCEQDDDLTAASINALRHKAGRPDLPIRIVTQGDERPWAEEIAEEAGKLRLVDFGVTYSAEGEYGSVTNIRLPNGEAMPDPIKSPAPWVDTLEDDVGRYNDGPDVPMLAQQVARVFPKHADYAAVAGQGTAWCGIYVAFKLSRYGIEPPYSGKPDVNSWMYVDSWLKLKGGTPIPVGQQRPGDIALFINPPWNRNIHHVNFYFGDGKYIGGNQNNSVTKASYGAPTHIIRPPAPESYVPQPEQMPLLFIESNGDAVRTLQTMLNAALDLDLEVDGEFGPDTEAAVKQYQEKHSLEVDGIVGPETWASLFEQTPVPEPKPTEYLLTPEQIAEISRMAAASAIAQYPWKDRGKAPLGFTKGMAVMYAQCCRKLAANDSAVMAMSQPIGSSSKDALAHYTVAATGRQNVLRKLFVMKYGLGMRESSGNYTEGRDMSASNVTADTAEAGLFQQSWNSNVASPEMRKLLTAYQSEDHPCYSTIFKEGVSVKDTNSFGTGPGREFQELAKRCPAFATEMCGVGLRVLYNHWGPVVRQEVEMRAEAEALLLQVETYLKTQPVPEPEPEPKPPPPLTDLGKAKKRAMDDIEKAVDTLIKDVQRLGGQSQVSSGGFVMPNIPPALTNTAIRFAWPYIAQMSAEDVIALKDKIVAGKFELSDLFNIVGSGGSRPMFLTSGGNVIDQMLEAEAQASKDQPKQGVSFMQSESLWVNIRYLLISVGVGILVKYSGGLFSPESAEQIITPLVGALLAGLTAIWGNYVRAGTRSVPTAVAKREDVPTVSPATGAVDPGNVYR